MERRTSAHGTRTGDALGSRCALTCSAAAHTPRSCPPWLGRDPRAGPRAGARSAERSGRAPPALARDAAAAAPRIIAVTAAIAPPTPRAAAARAPRSVAAHGQADGSCGRENSLDPQPQPYQKSGLGSP